MSNGNFHYGKSGFTYKKKSGGGNHRILSLGSITNSYADVNTHFVAGSGVGASCIATRRAKLNHATVCNGLGQCNKIFANLGLQSKGGSNKYALNWYNNVSSNITSNITSTSVPDIPTNIQVITYTETFNNLSVFISWNKPNDNGSSILYYIVSGNNDTGTQTTTNLNTIFNNLTHNSTYTFTVIAVNSNGNSIAGISSTINPTITVYALVVGGGGGGGCGSNAGTGAGGGAGGILLDSTNTVHNGYNYRVIVGSGGNGGNNTVESSNGNASFANFNNILIYCYGGGGGYGNISSLNSGGSGGSGLVVIYYSTISTIALATGGTITSTISNGIYTYYHTFTNSGSFNT